MKRYDLVTNYRAGSCIEEMERSDDGEWVRYEDVEPHLRARPAQPAAPAPDSKLLSGLTLADSVLGAAAPAPEGLEQSEDSGVTDAVTAAVREADRTFERVGGSSRHWTRDCFLPVLNRHGFTVVRARPALSDEALREMALTEARRTWAALMDGVGTHSEGLDIEIIATRMEALARAVLARQQAGG